LQGLDCDQRLLSTEDHDLKRGRAVASNHKGPSTGSATGNVKKQKRKADPGGRHPSRDKGRASVIKRKC